MKQNKKAIRRTFKKQFFRGNHFLFALVLLTTVLSAAINLVLSWMMQQLIDTASGNPGTFRLWDLALMTAALLGGIVLIGMLQYVSRPLFLKRAMEQYKNFAFRELTKKSIASFSMENTAAYISALSNDANSIETNYLEQYFTLINELLLFFGAFGMMLWYSPLLTLAAFLLSLLPMVVSIPAGTRLAREEEEVSRRNESFTAALKDSLSGFSVVKSFRAEKEMIRLFAKSNGEAEEAKCRRRKTGTVISLMGAVAGAAAQLGVFLAGAYLAVTDQGVTPGTVLVFVQLMNFVIQPISEVPGILTNRKAANALIDKLADAVYSNVRQEGKKISPKLEQAIRIKNLTFSYEEGKEALQDITMELESGKSYAIVGGSGSGKSTLLNLLMGSRSDYTGEIFFDGEELRGIGSESLYELMSLVQQNVFVFDSSIRDNITMFREFDSEAVERAIAWSGLSSLLRERGEDYRCGENGCNLSGGERQRISIARSLLRKTPVLLVDEATAALDKETAFQVTDSILKMEGITRIIVTHALEEGLLQRYDRIFVLKKGRLEEVGGFEELMEKKGYFYSLYTVSQ